MNSAARIISHPATPTYHSFADFECSASTNGFIWVFATIARGMDRR